MSRRANQLIFGPMRRRAGFTLVEVLLGLGILMILVGGMFGFLWGLASRREILTRAAARAQGMDLLLDRLEADLLLAVAGDGAGGAGLRGDSTQLMIASRQVWTPAEAGESPAALAGHLMSTYRFSSESGRVVLTRSGVSDRPDAAASGPDEELPGDFGRVRLRYWDGEAWSDRYDSLSAGRLPAAVEVAVWFELPSFESERPAGAVSGSEVGNGTAHEIGPDTGAAPVARSAWSSAPAAVTAPDRRRILPVADAADSAEEDQP